MTKKNRNQNNTIENIEVGEMENQEVVTVAATKPLNIRDRLRQELAQMDEFNESLQGNIETLIQAIRDNSTFAEKSDTDTKAVKAYKNKKLKRFNVVVNGCIRDLKALNTATEENEENDTLENSENI